MRISSLRMFLAVACVGLIAAGCAGSNPFGELATQLKADFGIAKTDIVAVAKKIDQGLVLVEADLPGACTLVGQAANIAGDVANSTSGAVAADLGAASGVAGAVTKSAICSGSLVGADLKAFTADVVSAFKSVKAAFKKATGQTVTATALATSPIAQ